MEAHSNLSGIGCIVLGILAILVALVIGLGAFGAGFWEGEFGVAGRMAMVAVALLVAGVASIAGGIAMRSPGRKNR